jgi:hypothetical protein
VVDVHAVNQILSIRNGVWTGVALIAVGLFRLWPIIPAIMAQWIARRQTIAAEKAADWDRLRDEVERYSERLSGVETREQECQRQLTDAMRRIAELEGYMMGQGKARQDAAAIVASERLAEREEKNKK